MAIDGSIKVFRQIHEHMGGLTWTSVESGILIANITHSRCSSKSYSIWKVRGNVCVPKKIPRVGPDHRAIVSLHAIAELDNTAVDCSTTQLSTPNTLELLQVNFPVWQEVKVLAPWFRRKQKGDVKRKTKFIMFMDRGSKWQACPLLICYELESL